MRIKPNKIPIEKWKKYKGKFVVWADNKWKNVGQIVEILKGKKKVYIRFSQNYLKANPLENITGRKENMFKKFNLEKNEWFLFNTLEEVKCFYDKLDILNNLI